MKEDYLWDKAGEDAEIERLENVLSAFRYEQAAAPLPAVTALPAKSGRRWFFPLKFAFAAGMAALVIAGAAFVLWPGIETASVAELPPPQLPVRQGSVPAEMPKAESPAGPAGAERVALKQHSPARQVRKTETKRRSARDQKPALTADEKYAYDQLMLALSISGSKLKIVKDAVNGTDATAKEIPEPNSK